MQVGKVLLIGGSPMTGKTSVAVALASMLECPCISTDDIGEALQTLAPIDPVKGEDRTAYYEQATPEKLAEDIRKYHEAMWPAIEKITENHADWAGPLVMEGWALYPEHVKNLLGPDVQAVWLVASEELMEKRVAQCAKAKAAQNYVARSQWHNELMRRGCEEWDLPCIELAGDESISSLVGSVWSMAL